MEPRAAKHTEGVEPIALEQQIRGFVEDHLRDWLAERPLPPNLRAAVHYVLDGGGKRVRPILTWHACAAVGGDPRRALPAAGAIEMVHDFSLVHDDLPAMDDDDLRRGRPTLHRHASEAMAILAGDVLLGLAFELLATRTAPLGLAGVLCAELARATDDMIAGQAYDTLPEFDEELEPLERLRMIHTHKTGALIRCAARMGALVGRADPVQLAAITTYAERIGLMFQVVDDVLDVTQTSEHLGKTAQKDVLQGKLTYPGLLGLEGSRGEVQRLRDEAEAALAPLGAAADPLRRLSDDLARRTR